MGSMYVVFLHVTGLIETVNQQKSKSHEQYLITLLVEAGRSGGGGVVRRAVLVQN